MRTLRVLITVCLPALVVPAALSAQTEDHAIRPWTFRTRAVLTGSSESSDPAGYTALSAFASVLLNVDFEWHKCTANVDEEGTRTATLKIHPFSIGVGVGFHF
jgi:hypothetical protein